MFANTSASWLAEDQRTWSGTPSGTVTMDTGCQGWQHHSIDFLFNGSKECIELIGEGSVIASDIA